ncbi:hypothetical protein [Ensifer sp. ENS12]|uniref:hypothetical protein n=1 Tax=unclassified Ensifer TaxID=2633371 RepID=UPI000DDCACA8|nr:hypothetical protein [Ensifer sp. ENS12]MBV7518366.1 hypothetical protein [Ensifer sp. ENS12]
MLKRFLAKWRLWEQALDGIDDLHGDHLVNLEKRVLILEREMTLLKETRSSESPIERLLSLDKLNSEGGRGSVGIPALIPAKGN